MRLRATVLSGKKKQAVKEFLTKGRIACRVVIED